MSLYASIAYICCQRIVIDRENNQKLKRQLAEAEKRLLAMQALLTAKSTARASIDETITPSADENEDELVDGIESEDEADDAALTPVCFCSTIGRS